MVIAILVLVFLLAFGYVIWKRGDQDGDGDFDISDIKVSAQEIKEDIQEGVEDAIEDVKDTVEDVVDEIKDVVSVITGKPTKAKLNSLTKKQLVESAKADHNADLDIKETKSQLVNKVYKLYH